MKKIAKVKIQDNPEGNNIIIGIVRFTDDTGQDGFKVVTNFSDNFGDNKAQTASKCRADIFDIWGWWDTYVELLVEKEEEK